MSVSFDTSRQRIEKALERANVVKYLANFIDEEVYDSEITLLSTEEMKELIDKMGPRKRFLKAFQEITQEFELNEQQRNDKKRKHESSNNNNLSQPPLKKHKNNDHHNNNNKKQNGTNFNENMAFNRNTNSIQHVKIEEFVNVKQENDVKHEPNYNSNRNVLFNDNKGLISNISIGTVSNNSNNIHQIQLTQSYFDAIHQNDTNKLLYLKFRLVFKQKNKGKLIQSEQILKFVQQYSLQNIIDILYSNHKQEAIGSILGRIIESYSDKVKQFEDILGEEFDVENRLNILNKNKKNLSMTDLISLLIISSNVCEKEKLLHWMKSMNFKQLFVENNNLSKPLNDLQQIYNDESKLKQHLNIISSEIGVLFRLFGWSMSQYTDLSDKAAVYLQKKHKIKNNGINNEILIIESEFIEYENEYKCKTCPGKKFPKIQNQENQIKNLMEHIYGKKHKKNKKKKIQQNQ